MVTVVIHNERIISAPGMNGLPYKEGYGLSTDVVQTSDGKYKIPGFKNPHNASPFYEMDKTDVNGDMVNKIWMYDAENDNWNRQ